MNGVRRELAVFTFSASKFFLQVGLMILPTLRSFTNHSVTSQGFQLDF
jgi:hypothetical protein